MSEAQPLRKRMVWRLETLAYDGVSLILRLLPFGAVSGLGGWLVERIGPRTSKHKIVRRNLELAFPDMSESERDVLARESWNGIGRTFAEFPLTHRLKPFDPNSRIAVRGLEIFKAHAPCVIVTGHFANWEVMATVLTQSDLPVRITYRKINNPYLDQRVRAQRQAYGTKFLVQKSTHRGGRELFEALKAGETVALLNDQKFNTGLSRPFFGADAMTAPGAVRLARKTNRPLLPMSVYREGADFVVEFFEPLPIPRGGERDNDIEQGVDLVNRFVESRIEAHPPQWFWVHRRWPKEQYRGK